MSDRVELFDRYKLLQTFVIEQMSKPFSWGEHDCSIFALKALEIQLNKKIENPFIGKYKTITGAVKLLNKNGGMKAILARELPKYNVIKRETPKKAKRGDLVLFRQEGELVCGVVDLSGLGILIPSDEGLRNIYFRNVHIEEAWGID
jgi:hypothetical protein